MEKEYYWLFKTIKGCPTEEGVPVCPICGAPSITTLFKKCRNCGTPLKLKSESNMEEEN